MSATTTLSCSGCGVAGVEVEHGNPGAGELCAGPGTMSQHGALYCADCISEIPRPPETVVAVRMTVRDAAVLLAHLDGHRSCAQIQEALDRIADSIRESISPEEYEREFPIEPVPAKNG